MKALFKAAVPSFVIAMSIGATAPPQVWAEESSRPIEEVIVTARYRKETA